MRGTGPASSSERARPMARRAPDDARTEPYRTPHARTSQNAP